MEKRTAMQIVTMPGWHGVPPVLMALDNEGRIWCRQMLSGEWLLVEDLPQGVLK